MVTTLPLTIGGMPADEVFHKITEIGIKREEATQLLGYWLLFQADKTRRVFNFRTAFPASDPECSTDFARSLDHQDWVDGESVVQAEQTTGEDGFNLRFHRIEDDLDALGRDVAKTFLCLAEMRSGIHSLLEEVRLEINRLNDDVFECCKKSEAGTRLPVGPMREAIGPAMFHGAVTFKGKQVGLWQVGEEMIMLPTVTGVATDVVVDPVADPLLAMGSDLADWTEENESRIAETFDNQPLTRTAVEREFGTEVTRNGFRVGDVVNAIFHERARWATASEMVDSALERVPLIIRAASPEARERVSERLGVAAGESITNVAPTRLADAGSLEAREASEVLERSDVSTVGNLVERTPAELGAVMESAGVRMPLGAVAGLRARAVMLNNLVR